MCREKFVKLLSCDTPCGVVKCGTCLCVARNLLSYCLVIHRMVWSMRHLSVCREKFVKLLSCDTPCGVVKCGTCLCVARYLLSYCLVIHRVVWSNPALVCV